MPRGVPPTAEQVKAARAKYGFTQKEAGALVYYTLSGWQRIEQGERELHPAIWEYWQIRAKEESSRQKTQ
jgi:transcriptional regulator with XRE-family HTH domain